MERRSEARTELGPWVERLAWNAAALAALAVMLLVLLASLEWLDHMTKAPATTPRTSRAQERADSSCAPKKVRTDRRAVGLLHRSVL
jgi:hypothetical protein